MGGETDDDALGAQEIADRLVRFTGALGDVTEARLAAEAFLRDLTRVLPPTSPDHYDDILLVVTELAANSVEYAPGPFELRLRRAFDGVHVILRDTSQEAPVARSFDPGRGGRGIGWYLVQSLSNQVGVITHERGKDVHAFLPW
ncbi:ATP-binding protein [Streptomyces sp. GXMU-J15]|uniref:ATP-binding protein n=1 Tax=Streptomyces fuscus TaxID=3048495 RepID=A0ABT7J8W7_9ACTN|nr:MULTISPECIES: ATP-binding protein [Streptomyces]MDL2080831.1 ATP-binding protein [Streptomyces fuscus]SBT94138.1 Anti-sigma regulatory factor (Ser/Thr protein kinase) [Streptomyces sp. DI166]